MDGLKKVFAVGIPQIRSDTIFFRSGDETWEFPTYDVVGHHGKSIAHYNGLYYEAKISALRKLAKKSKKA